MRRVAIGAAFLLACAIHSPSSAQRISRPPAAGAPARLTSEMGDIPCFKNLADYRSFLALCKNPTAKSYAAIKDSYRRTLWVLPEGTRVAIREYAPPPGAPSLESLASPAAIPPVVARAEGIESPLWIPAIYARDPGSLLYPVEAKMPVIRRAFDFNATPAAGVTHEFVADNGRAPLYVAKDADSLERLERAVKANDARGIEDMVRTGRVAGVAGGVRAKVIRNINFLEGGTPASEVRLIDDENGGETVFAYSFSLGLPTINVVTARDARQRRMPRQD